MAANEKGGSNEALCRTVAKSVRPYKAGFLSKAPLSHLLIYIERRELSGTLWIYDDTQDSSLLFVRGAPAKVRTTHTTPYLGELLIELEHIDRRAYEETIHFALRGGGLHGAMLRACGHLGQKELEAGLREQTALRLIQVSRNVTPRTHFALFRDVDLLASWGGEELTPIDPWWVLWWGTRDRPPEPAAQSVFDLLDEDPIALREDVAWQRFGFGRIEREFLTWWSENPSTLEDLLSYSGLPRDVVANMVYVLFLTRCIVFEEAEPTRVRLAPQAQARSADGVDLEAVEKTSVRAAPTASRSDMTQQMSAPAFDDEEALTDVDGEVDIPIIVAPSIVDIQEPLSGEAEVTEVMETPLRHEPIDRPKKSRRVSRMAQAFRTLLDPMEHGELDGVPALRGPTASELELASHASAMEITSKFIQAFGGGDFERAQELAANALELLPDNALLKANYVLAQLPSRPSAARIKDMLEVLNDATRTDPGLDRPYFVRGKIFQQLNMPIKAYAEFRAAFARNPHGAEAAAEIERYAAKDENTSMHVAMDREAGPAAVPNRAGALLRRHEMG